jgi:hypothetical protein
MAVPIVRPFCLQNCWRSLCAIISETLPTSGYGIMKNYGGQGKPFLFLSDLISLMWFRSSTGYHVGSSLLAHELNYNRLIAFYLSRDKRGLKGK